jgi:predicted aspartyl protease
MKAGRQWSFFALPALILTGLMAMAPGVAAGCMPAVRAAVQVRAAGKPLVEIPFTLVDDHIVLPVTIDESPEIRALLDTGMPMKGLLLLDPDIAEHLGLKYSGTIDLGGGGEARTVTADVISGVTLAFAGFAFPGQRIFVLRDTEFADDWPAEAVLGTTLFDHVVEIDFSASKIRLYEEVDDLPHEPGHRFDLAFTMGIPVVEADIAVDGADLVPVTLMADTGVNAPLLVFPYSEEGLAPPDDAVETRTGVLSEGLTGDIYGRIGRVASLELGPYDFDRVVAAFPTRASMGHADLLGQNGFVGTGLFKRFDVVFDYPNGSLYLDPNDTYGARFEWNMAGLLMGVNREGFLKIKDVVDGTPGAVENLRADDTIVTLDGRDIRKLDNETINNLFNEEGARLHLGVQRGSDRLEVTLTLRRIL